MKILLLEDGLPAQVFVDFLREIEKTHGIQFEIDRPQSEEAALKLVGSADIAIIDLGNKWRELASHLASSPTVPLILTSYHEMDFNLEAHENYWFRFLRKPEINLKKFERTIRDFWFIYRPDFWFN